MRSAAVLALVLLGALACSTVQVTSDYDQSRDFSKYKTFVWLLVKPVPTGLPTLDTPMVQERIQRSVEAALASKGFTQVAENADFAVKYQLTAQQKVDVHTDDNAFLYGADGFSIGVPATTVEQYEEGTLIIDVFDTQEKKLVWRGIGQGRLRGESAQADPTESEQRIQSAVNQVLAEFPPGAKAK